MALTPAQLLDELMGPNRNALPNEAKSELHWSDDNVCKRFLCGFCPSQLFTNTRSDLGPCEKIHDENLRQLYKKSKRNGKMQYEEDFLRYLQSIMADVERRIRRGHQRLSLNAKTKENKDISQEDEEKVMEISRDINALIPQVEELGSEGRVDEAQALTEQIDKLKEQRERIQAVVISIIKDPMSNQDKQMEVCETCGAFLIVGDAQSRVDDHLMGKQHMGYAKIKLTIEELLVIFVHHFLFMCMYYW
ncbi:uncharacterized protein TRIADDRAFT_20548 [Trichoplax adhaerens]|uniref:LUC7-like protein n=1 Tax=Trichoplax adhaerens TaxID=10228 RepID=B3RQ49_TRIAD|nr:hypothetical protein TRIADDRAFT_20548 [Trichoplax adhaerens]EDV27758.1 hypothetical protein TRIADDRAFT_20548 [Trichoplax adhaerens]|eukprot:XP_002109592.1 hypothetical protein TRIADDRAFT_20548 [Trichoplax adhaerens]